MNNNQVIVNVQGYGQYIVPADKVGQLVAMLTSMSVPVESTQIPTGKTLING